MKTILILLLILVINV